MDSNEPQAEVLKELARRRGEVLLSLESWCQALKNVEVTMVPYKQGEKAGNEGDGDPCASKERQEKLQSRLRDALFVDICNILSFPETASEKKPAPVNKQGAAQNGDPGPGITVTKQEAPNGDGPQRKEARCNVKSASTPSTPVKVSSRQISKSSGAMTTPRGSGRLVGPNTRNLGLGLTSREPLTSRRSLMGHGPATSLTPRRPTASLSLSSSQRGVTTSTPKVRPVATSELSASARQFQMPAFAGVNRRASSPRGSPTASERRGVQRESSLKVYYKRAFAGTDLEDTAWVITGGGGGVTSDILPTSSGHDDAYGFMDMRMSLDEIEITAISHGGVKGTYIERSKTTLTPRLKPEASEVSLEISV
eukprot:symbB.v1.2.033398.t1/scaffold4143.1/size43926/2